MSQPTNPKPEATPAPAATEQPAAAAQPSTETKPADVTRLALQRLGYAVEDELPPEETPPAGDATPPDGNPPAKGAPPAEGTPPAGGEVTPPAPAAPEQKPPTPRIKPKVKPAAPAAPTTADIVKSVVEAMNQTKQPPAAAAPATPQEPELSDFDREEYELARFAAEAMPEKYKGFDAKVLSFVKRRDEEIKAIIAEDGEFDPQSERYQKFIRENRPTFQGADRQRLMREQVKREVMSEADRKIQEREQQLDRKIRHLETAPVIRQEVQAAAESVLTLDDDAVKEFKADPKKAADDNPIEAPIIERAVQDVTAMTEEYLKISNGLIDPDPKNEIHVALSALMEHQGKLLDSMPEEQRTASDGRVFISVERYLELKERKDPALKQYRTIDAKLGVGLIREFGKNVVQTRLKETRERLARAGFKREKAAPATPAAPAGAAPAPAPAAAPAKPAPKATVTPAAAPPSKPAGKTDAAPHLKVLGISDSDE
jgi:hypothetical protein